jgi:bidirectional [NiFe] hydrogenase diaphorase subunit
MFAKPEVLNDSHCKALDRAMKKLGYAKSSLIESLHAMQEAFGFLDDEPVKFVGASFRLPLSKVYGVATF